MRRAFCCMAAFLAVSTSGFGQAASSDSQTLQALLSEVRALRQDLRVSLNRTQASQILLARLQLQQGAVARATDHLNEVRQKLLETRVHQRELSNELKRTEEAMSTANSSADNPQALQDRIKHIKSDLEIEGNTAQQQQAIEIQAAQQLRDEQDKLSAIEGQLDELIRTPGSTPAPAGSNRP